MILMELITLTTIPVIPVLINPNQPSLGKSGNFTSTEKSSTNYNSVTVPNFAISTLDPKNNSRSIEHSQLRIETTITFSDNNNNVTKTYTKNISNPLKIQQAIEFEWPTGQPTTLLPMPSSLENKIIFDENQNPQSARHDLNTTLVNCTETQTVFNGTCFSVLKQLPCPAGQWLIEDESSKTGKCVENKCAGEMPDTAYYNGKCVKIKSEDSCPSGMKTYIFKTGQVDCDCKEGFLYDEKSGNCYEAYRQGPCQKTQYFAIPSPKFGQTNRPKPACIPNPCIFDGYFCQAVKCPLKKTRGPVLTTDQLPRNCAKFGTPCTQSGRGLFAIHPASNTPFCIEDIMDISRPDRVIGNVPTLKCSPGSRRDILGHCRAPTVIDFS